MTASATRFVIWLLFWIGLAIFNSVQHGVGSTPQPSATSDAQLPPAVLSPQLPLVPTPTPPALFPSQPPSNTSAGPTADSIAAELVRVAAGAPAEFPRVQASPSYHTLATGDQALLTGSGMQFATDLNAAMANLGYRWDGGSFFTACSPGGTHCGCSWQNVGPGGYFWVTWEITASDCVLSSACGATSG